MSAQPLGATSTSRTFPGRRIVSFSSTSRLVGRLRIRSRTRVCRDANRQRLVRCFGGAASGAVVFGIHRSLTFMPRRNPAHRSPPLTSTKVDPKRGQIAVPDGRSRRAEARPGEACPARSVQLRLRGDSPPPLLSRGDVIEQAPHRAVMVLWWRPPAVRRGVSESLTGPRFRSIVYDPGPVAAGGDTGCRGVRCSRPGRGRIARTAPVRTTWTPASMASMNGSPRMWRMIAMLVS